SRHRQKRVGAAASGDELGYVRPPPFDPASLWACETIDARAGHQLLSPADQRIVLVEAVEFRTHEPRGLDELELSGDVCVQRDEAQPPPFPIRFCLLMVGTATPDDAVEARGRQ